mgnify:CR=1 FL=1
MRVIMVMVSSVNGKITKGDDPDVSSWSSPEDAKLFAGLLQKYSLFVMGSATYEAARKKIVLSPGKLRVVMTRTPKIYEDEAVPGRLEFTSEPVTTLVRRLEKRGYKDMLLLGGGTINVLFLEAGLVSEIRLTIEPWLFMTGSDLVKAIRTGSVPISDTQLKLTRIEKLNDRGTLHLIYEVVK